MSTTAIILALVLSAVFVVGLALYARPRYARLAARREEVGDVELPMRAQLRLIAIAAAGIIAGNAVAIVLRNDAGLLVCVTMVGVTLWLVVWLSVREAEAAQRRAAR